MDDHVWLRIGDQDDYRAFDSLADAAEELHYILHLGKYEYPDKCEGHTVTRYFGPALRGIEVDDYYQGDNGISLYIGNDDAQYERELCAEELTAFLHFLDAGQGQLE